MLGKNYLSSEPKPGPIEGMLLEKRNIQNIITNRKRMSYYIGFNKGKGSPIVRGLPLRLFWCVPTRKEGAWEFGWGPPWDRREGGVLRGKVVLHRFLFFFRYGLEGLSSTQR